MAQAKGVDVYYGQKKIDWKKVAASGISFALIRASRAGQTTGKPFADPMFAENWQKAMDAGLLISAWHYFVVQHDCATQVDFFLDTFGSRKANFPLILDFEFTLGKMSVQESTACAIQAVQEMENRTGRKPMIYTRDTWWRPRIASSPAWAAHDLWVAHYTDDNKPRMPPDFNGWKFWQWSDSGQIPGISTVVDLDRFQGSEADLRQYASQF